MKTFDDTDILAPLAQWRNDPSPLNGDSLMKSLRPTIDMGIKRYGGKLSGPALTTHAKLIAFDAAKKYDPRGGPFKPYLLSNLQGLQRFSGQETAALRVPERDRIEGARVLKESENLTDQLGRSPSDGELADYMFMSAKKINKLRNLTQGGIPESAMDGAGGAEEPDTDMWHKYIYNTLPPQMQFVMDHSLGTNGKPILSTAELARRRGVSAAAISQQKAKIQSLLDEVKKGF